MFGTQPKPDPEVAALKESVRYNEKSIDRIETELKEFRAETKAEFSALRTEIKAEVNRLDTLINKVSSNIWKQIVGSAVAIILANVILKYWPQ